MKRIIFGAGRTGQSIASQLLRDPNNDIIGFIDSDQRKWGIRVSDRLVLGGVESLKNIDFDDVVLGTLAGSSIMKEALIQSGIPLEKINGSFVEGAFVTRRNFLYDYSFMCADIDRSIPVAEVGVFQGEFAAAISRAFPGRSFYLFDTFEGFDARDVAVEIREGFSHSEEKHFSNTTVEEALSKLENKNLAVVCKGYFPETTKEVQEDQFLFVSLDVDLYLPTLAGLEYFYPKMVPGGCILIDDYYGEGYRGVKAAIDLYESKCGKLIKCPIGDHSGIAILKQ